MRPRSIRWKATATAADLEYAGRKISAMRGTVILQRGAWLIRWAA